VAHYCLEAYAAVSEVRLAALSKEQTRRARRRAERACRAQADAARIFPIAAARCLVHRAALQWLSGHRAGARSSWKQGLARAESLRMPREAARASELAAALGIAFPSPP
jgi:trans-aconitate methyltransferase